MKRTGVRISKKAALSLIDFMADVSVPKKEVVVIMIPFGPSSAERVAEEFVKLCQER